MPEGIVVLRYHHGKTFDTSHHLDEGQFEAQFARVATTPRRSHNERTFSWVVVAANALINGSCHSGEHPGVCPPNRQWHRGRR